MAPNETAPRRLELLYLTPAEIVPYDKNPRDNKEAIKAVAESIREYGFRIPLVLDANNVIVTGHTRFEAAKLLKLPEIPVTYAKELTQAQITAFRLVDNKTSELSKWDFDLLAGEVATLAEVGIDLTPYGWTNEELDCLREVVAGEDLTNMKGPEDLMGDGVHKAALNNLLGFGHITNDAKSARITIGEFNYFMDITDYRRWAENVRKVCNYDKQAIVYYLADKLGMLDEVKDYDRKAVAKAAEGTEEALRAHREVAEQQMNENREKAKEREARRAQQAADQERIRKERDEQRAEKARVAQEKLDKLNADKEAERAERARLREEKMAQVLADKEANKQKRAEAKAKAQADDARAAEADHKAKVAASGGPDPQPAVQVQKMKPRAAPVPA